MARLLEHLDGFNRKERFFLVGMALGKPSFSLSQEFRERLKRALGLEIPRDAFVAMDYHLDWLYASVYLSEHGERTGPYPNLDGLIRAQLEDIDLLIAYEAARTCHIVLLEAKGVISFDNRQMDSKAARLRDIFGENGDAHPGATPHFAIVSPRRPRKLIADRWPAWMRGTDRIPWIELPLPSGRKKITRCTDQGLQSAAGQHWKVQPEASWSPSPNRDSPT